MVNYSIEKYLEKGGLITVITAQSKHNAWTKKKRKPILKPVIFIDQNILSQFKCSMCSSRSSCTAICPPIAWMIRQVEYEPPREASLGHEPLNSRAPAQFSPEAATIEWPQVESTGVTIIKKYFTEHKTAKQIAKELNISIQYTYRELKKYKGIIVSKARNLV
jgi:hypothetical protein